MLLPNNQHDYNRNNNYPEPIPAYDQEDDDLYELAGPSYPTPTYAKRDKIDEIISAMLEASRSGNIDKAQNLFYGAVEKGLLSKALYRTWIKIAGIYGRIDEAEKTFN